MTLGALTFRPLKAAIRAITSQERTIAMLSGFFGALALLLAGIGLYGVMTYSVTRRAAEIGIRIALGAQRSDILRMVLSEGLRLAVIGIVLGAAGSLALTRVLASFRQACRPPRQTLAGLSRHLLQDRRCTHRAWCLCDGR